MSLDDLLKQAQDLGEQAVDKAKDVVDDRGGTDALKTDATEVKEAMTGEGSLKDRATEAMEAVKDPGAPGAEGSAPQDPVRK
jgi:hypothetical protein